MKYIVSCILIFINAGFSYGQACSDYSKILKLLDTVRITKITELKIGFSQGATRDTLIHYVGHYDDLGNLVREEKDFGFRNDLGEFRPRQVITYRYNSDSVFVYSKMEKLSPYLAISRDYPPMSTTFVSDSINRPKEEIRVHHYGIGTDRKVYIYEGNWLRRIECWKQRNQERPMLAYYYTILYELAK